MGLDFGVLLSLRFVVCLLLAFGVTALVVGKAYRALRRDERYTFSYLDGGIFAGRQASPKLMLVAAAVYGLGMIALTAWPMGVYRSLENLTSGCLDIVSEEELAGIGIPPIIKARPHELKRSCSLTLTADTEAHHWFHIEVDPGLGYGRILEKELNEADPEGTGRSALGAIGKADAVWLTPSRSGHRAFVTHRQGGIRMHLPTTLFDRAQSEAVARLAATRADVVLPYVAAALESRSGPSWWRSYGRWLPLLLIGGALAVYVTLLTVRRRKALKRALEA